MNRTEVINELKKAKAALRIKFMGRGSEIQRINTGDLAVANADPELIRDMAHYIAMLNSEGVAHRLERDEERTGRRVWSGELGEER